MENSYRPVIIGGGIAGCAVAYFLTKNKEKPIVIEKRKSIGGKTCTGLVSKKILDIINLPKGIIKNRIKKAIIHFPNGDLEIKGKEEALVLDRDNFVKELYEKAKKGGADFLFEESLLRFAVADKVIFRTDKRAQKTDVLVGADGVGSVVAKKYGIAKRVETVSQAYAQYGGDDVEIFLGKEYGYPFGYVVPYGDGTSIIGIGGGRVKLEKFLDFLGAKKVYKWQAGAIPVGLPKYSAFERVLLIGDAGGFVKAFSGGSININLMLAKKMAKAIRKAYEVGDFSTKFFTKNYEEVWKKDIGKELKDNYIIRKAYESMSESDLSQLYNILSKEEIKGLIAEKGDMDFYSSFFRALLHDRNVWGLGLKILAKNPSIIWDFF